VTLFKIVNYYLLSYYLLSKIMCFVFYIDRGDVTYIH
jgi:hypothetical protein